MTTSSRLVFFGTEHFSVPTLQALIDQPKFDIVAVVTKPDSTYGRGRQNYTSPVKKLALAHNLHVLQPHKVKDCIQDLAALRPDAGVLVSYGKIIPQSLLDVFEPVGIINVHPSRLPEFRGPSPIEATLLSGQKQTAVSIMKLDAGMDTGPVFAQEPVDLADFMSKSELYDLLARRGAQAVARLLPSILTGQTRPYPQKNSAVSVTSLIRKEDGLLHPETETAEQLERKIRAYQTFPKPRLRVGENDVIVTSSHVVQQVIPGHLVVPCFAETLLQIDTLLAPNGKSMSGEAYLRGYGTIKKDA